MAKKATIKDVAKAAEVSVATVSYVMNNRTDIKITEETKKKVLQVANLLNYSPNQAAKALATQYKNMIAIIMPETGSVLSEAENMHTLKMLTHFFHKEHFDLLLLDPSTCERYDRADAIICYNISTTQFHALGDNNFVPLIALDCFVNDPLFFQINSSSELYRKASEAFESEPFRYVFLQSPNKERMQYLKNDLGSDNITFISSLSDCEKIKNSNIITGDIVLSRILGHTNNVCYVDGLFESKENVLLSCIKDAINRVKVTEHNFLTS